MKKLIAFLTVLGLLISNTSTMAASNCQGQDEGNRQPNITAPIYPFFDFPGQDV